jgi:hypothetical protein
MQSKYRSGKSVAKNPTVPISDDDPRLAWDKISNTKSRQGAEIDIIGLDGKSLVSGGTKAGNVSGSSSTKPTDNSVAKSKISLVANGTIHYLNRDSITPTAVTNAAATWDGEDLTVTFDWDYLNNYNQLVSHFILELTVDGIAERTPLTSFIPNRTGIGQTLTVTKTINTQTFGVFRTNISSICIIATDAYYNESSKVCVTSIPTYVLDLPTPTITVTAISSGYSVAYTTPTEDVYDAIEVVEYESTSSTAPTNVTYVRAYFGTVNPANVITQNFNDRWVKARFTSDSGVTTPFSTAYKVTPLSPITVDTTGPGNVGSVTVVGSLDLEGPIGFHGHATISWDSVTGGGIRGYRIRWREVATPATSYSYVDSPGTALTYHLSGLGVGLTYEFAVATYDEFNNTSTQYVAGNNVTITGTPYIAGTVDVSGFFRAKANPTDLDSTAFKFGYGVDTGKRGLVFNAHNYWYIDSEQSASLKVGGSTTNYISWNGSTFVIDGDITARSGSFTGNVLLNGGSLYAPGTGGSASSGIRTIFNSSGIAAYNAVGGYAQMLTTPLADGSVFTATAANIGGWKVSTSVIEKTSGDANISLDSTNGYISVSNSNVANNKAGINSPSTLDDVVFWAGSGSTPASTTNNFRVTLGGKLFASDATLTGAITATSGFIGDDVDNRWKLDGYTIENKGAARIRIGNYDLKSISGSDFSIFDHINSQTILTTDSVAGFARIFLGTTGRQVEVAKNAEISGDYSNSAQDYRSGGLRNMFTITQSQYTSSVFPDAATGSVLLVYDPDSA